MTYAIQIFGMIDGTPTPFDGKYVSRYEPEKWRLEDVASLDEMYAKIGEWLDVVDDPRDALQFENPGDAGACWKQETATVRPWDGKPNRPLTAFSVAVARVPE